MNNRLLEILICSLCKSTLQYDRANGELICRVNKLACLVHDGIPIMLADETRQTVEGMPVDPA